MKKIEEIRQALEFKEIIDVQLTEMRKSNIINFKKFKELYLFKQETEKLLELLGIN